MQRIGEMRRLTKSLFLCLAGTALLAHEVAHGAAEGADDAVRAIVAETGISRGLIVHIGCGDGLLTAALAKGDARLVHGLDSDPMAVQRCREHLRSLGLYGRASAEQWSGPHLPYRDSLVSLLVCERADLVSEAEIMRVLRPLGAAVIGKGDEGGGWRVLHKPWQQDIDEWNHALHDAGNNAVGHDELVGPPHHIRWVDGPTFARNHHFLSSVTAVVSANARLFSIIDEAPSAFIALPSEWRLIARDAFNGVVLWKRDIPTWGPQFRAFAAGPPELSRRLVAVENRVYGTLGLDAPLSMLDAASGETLMTYDGTEGTEEILYDAGVLYIVTGNPLGVRTTAALALAHYTTDAAERKALMAIDAQTGNLLWRKTGEQIAHLLPMGLAVRDGCAVFQNGNSVIGLDAKTGRRLWQFAREADRVRPGWSAPTLVIRDGVVLSFDREPNLPPTINQRTGKKSRTTGSASGKLFALSAATGEELWNCDATETLCSPGDVFVTGGLVWAGHATGRGAEEPDFTVARDLHTGEIVKKIQPDEAFTTTHHHRCYRNRATDRFILLGRRGIEFIDLESGEAMRHNWVRGACQSGIVPCNGLLYVPPHSCSCYVQSKLNGFYALAPKRKAESGEPRAEESPRLQRGSAYNTPLSAFRSPLSNDWPTYRHDAARSGRTLSSVPSEVALLWRASVGGRLSSPVVAGGRVFVASVDEQTVYCLDAATGEGLWHYVADGRVDSPPTYSGSWGAMSAMREVPTGRIMALDGTTLYGYGRQHWEIKGLTQSRPAPHHLWAIRQGGWADQMPGSREDLLKRNRDKTTINLATFTWSKAVPIHARTMVLAGKTLFIAGPPELQITEEDMAHSPTGVEHRERLAEQTLVWQGSQGALLLAVSTEDGAILSQVKLDSLPVWDGLIAANGRLYASAANGEVLCFGYPNRTVSSTGRQSRRR